jgi:hypothetical protein
MRLLVCGGRLFSDVTLMSFVLRCYHVVDPIVMMAHGGAPGADTLAGEWAARHKIETHVFRADWTKHGKQAGPIRNRQMLAEFAPTHVLAFQGGRGTADMLRAARAKGVPWQHIE